MSKDEKISNFIELIEARMAKEMPRIIREIKVYEDKLAKGELTKFPKVAPQFNG
ncbi:hypothetical protein [Owenweeksia hongkongensis]|uniref:hypothetical protein n=1 Tax=Owenweeksia hongkongensis TaxID=253245 RepID=UPI003A8F9185